MTFNIPAYRLDDLNEKITKLNRRAAKLGCQPATIQVLRTYSEDCRDSVTGAKYTETCVEIEVVGEAPKMNGWTLLGVVEHTEAGNILKAVPGQELPESYRTTNNTCEHCRTERFRREVFVVGHDEGQTVQVGRSCLRDFLGHQSAEDLAAIAEFYVRVEEAVKDELGGDSIRWVASIEHYLAITAVVIRRTGWVSKTKAMENDTDRPTASIVDQVLYSKNRATQELVEELKLHAEDRDTELAEKALAWARALEPKSNYEWNLKVACSLEYVDHRNGGIVASAIPAYLRAHDREVERAKRAARPKGEHVGTVGKRQQFDGCTIEALKYFESNWGVRTLVRFDFQGNTLIWWSSKELDWETGDVINIKGTIKAHEVFRDWPQTVLSRVAVVA